MPARARRRRMTAQMHARADFIIAARAARSPLARPPARSPARARPHGGRRNTHILSLFLSLSYPRRAARAGW